MLNWIIGGSAAGLFAAGYRKLGWKQALFDSFGFALLAFGSLRRNLVGLLSALGLGFFAAWKIFGRKQNKLNDPVLQGTAMTWLVAPGGMVVSAFAAILSILAAWLETDAA